MPGVRHDGHLRSQQLGQPCRLSRGVRGRRHDLRWCLRRFVRHLRVPRLKQELWNSDLFVRSEYSQLHDMQWARRLRLAPDPLHLHDLLQRRYVHREARVRSMSKRDPVRKWKLLQLPHHWDKRLLPVRLLELRHLRQSANRQRSLWPMRKQVRAQPLVRRRCLQLQRVCIPVIMWRLRQLDFRIEHDGRLGDRRAAWIVRYKRGHERTVVSEQIAFWRIVARGPDQRGQRVDNVCNGHGSNLFVGRRELGWLHAEVLDLIPRSARIRVTLPECHGRRMGCVRNKQHRRRGLAQRRSPGHLARNDIHLQRQ